MFISAFQTRYRGLAITRDSVSLIVSLVTDLPLGTEECAEFPEDMI